METNKTRWERELKSLFSGLTKSGCPCESPDELVRLAYLEKKVKKESFQDLGRHILSCDRCAAFWDRIQSFEHLSFQEMKCHAKADGYGRGEADRLQKALARRHLKGCPECRKLLETVSKPSTLEQIRELALSLREDFLLSLFGSMEYAHRSGARVKSVHRSESGKAEIEAWVLDAGERILMEPSGLPHRERITLEQGPLIDKDNHLVVELKDIPAGYGEVRVMLQREGHVLDLGTHPVDGSASRIKVPFPGEPRPVDPKILRVSLLLK